MIRPERADDAAERANIREVLERAFGQPDEADLVEALRADPSWLPSLALVALDDATGEVVGHIAFTRLGVGGAPALALAPLAVDPDHQRSGHGTALVHEALTRARASGEELVVVLGEPEYYARFGFGPAGRLGITGPFDEVAGDAFQAMRLGEGPAASGWCSYAAPFGVPQSRQ